MPAARPCSRGAPLTGEVLANEGERLRHLVREDEDEIVLANHVDRGGDGVRLAGYLHDLLVRQASGAEPFRDESRDRTRLATAEILVLLHDRDVEMPLFGGGAPGRANVLVAAVAGNGEDANAPPRRKVRHHLHQPADRRLVMRVVDEDAPAIAEPQDVEATRRERRRREEGEEASTNVVVAHTLNVGGGDCGEDVLSLKARRAA